MIHVLLIRRLLICLVCFMRDCTLVLGWELKCWLTCLMLMLCTGKVSANPRLKVLVFYTLGGQFPRSSLGGDSPLMVDSPVELSNGLELMVWLFDATL